MSDDCGKFLVDRPVSQILGMLLDSFVCPNKQCARVLPTQAAFRVTNYVILEGGFRDDSDELCS